MSAGNGEAKPEVVNPHGNVAAELRITAYEDGFVEATGPIANYHVMMQLCHAGMQVAIQQENQKQQAGKKILLAGPMPRNPFGRMPPRG